jgi:hypothetical protein
MWPLLEGRDSLSPGIRALGRTVLTPAMVFPESMQTPLIPSTLLVNPIAWGMVKTFAFKARHGVSHL